MCYNWRPGDERTGPNFYYTMPPANLSRVFAKIKKEIIFPEMLDILLRLWYYNDVRRGRQPRLKAGSRAEGFKSHRGRSEKVEKTS